MPDDLASGETNFFENRLDTKTKDDDLLIASGLSKRFPGVRALHEVSLSLRAGEVLAVIGENGAGKSTLMKILAGVQPPDCGEIFISGQPARFANTRAAMNHGIVLIHQELNLCDNLNVGQNIFLGREPTKSGMIDNRTIYQKSEGFLEQVGLNVSPKKLVGDLTIGRQQMVEIAKALSIEAKILIMDEPTSSLSAGESESLFRLIEKLRERGVAIIYISHRLAEVKRLADRIMILRDGEFAGELTGDEMTHQNMVNRMVGRDVSNVYVRTPHKIHDTVLSVTDLETPAWPTEKLNFELKAGEIVGLAGLVGAGRTELLRVLFGIDNAVGGTVQVEGQTVELNSPQAAIDQGIALIPEDRKAHGVLIDMNIQNNIGLPGLRIHSSRFGMANFKIQANTTREMIELLGIKTPTPYQLAKFLSGGNQQKVVIAKWLAMNPKILLLDEPTRGIDVGAKQEIYQLMEQLAAKSVAILFASSEMEEILGLSDRALVMHEGKLTGCVERENLSEEIIMKLATGNLEQETSA